jgi:hypothetical protein
VVQFLAHLQSLGTIQPQSAQHYLTAINTVHRLFGVPEPGHDPLVDQVRRGWQLARHAAGLQTAGRVGLPARVPALAIDRALQFPNMSLVNLRSLVYLAVGFAIMTRADTDVAIQRRHIQVTDGSIYISLVQEKGKQGEPTYRRLEMPRQAVSGLADLILLWQRRLLADAAARRYVLRDDEAFWRLPGETAPWTSASAVCARWLQDGCTFLNVAPPAGDLWQPHSLRIGAASAAHCIGVSEVQLKRWGGWAIKSNAHLTYIRPTQPDAAALRFYGWMLPAQLLANLPSAGPSRPAPLPSSSLAI